MVRADDDMAIRPQHTSRVQGPNLLLLLEGSVSKIPYIGTSRMGGILGLKLGKSLASRRIST